MGKLEVPAGDTFQTGPLIDSGARLVRGESPETSTLAAGVIDQLATAFAALRISDAPAANEYPPEVLDVSDSPVPLNSDDDVGEAGPYVRAEVCVTSNSTTSSKRAAKANPAAGRASTSDPLRAAIANLATPFVTDVDAADAGAQLDEERVRLHNEAISLADTKRRLEAIQRERDAAYGFTPAAEEP